ncbi:MAG: hypothetical protein AB7L13_04490 [Acidimicrobiia bacterium]
MGLTEFLLAELEVWHTRPITPTRRVALGHLVLPVDPPPGFGGILLGGVIATNIGQVDPDLVPDLHRLITEVDRGNRVVQPRLRHRFQVDRHGLARSCHRLVGQGDGIDFEFENNGTAAQQILGAVYATERLNAASRHAVATVLHKAMGWTGPIGPAFIAHVTGFSNALTSSVMSMVDPMAWALELLGFDASAKKPSKRDIKARFREKLRDAHPDHGGEADEAAKRIADLTEARRILGA